MNGFGKISTVVIGSLNTDIQATGLDRFPDAGEHLYGKELKIGPGGKSRNIADMIGHLTDPATVAMVGKTASDPYGLFRVPLDALQKTGVNTDFIDIVQDSEKMPAVALIAVTKDGENRIIVLPGISNDFRKADIEKARAAFSSATKNKGFLVLTLECPFETVKYALAVAAEMKLRVLFDPGGIEKNTNFNQLVKSGVYFIKPNEHEAQIITGIDVTDFASAHKAAAKIQQQGIENIMISHGKKGVYLFTKKLSKHILIPKVKPASIKDATGCGDQTIAALCAYLQKGMPIEQAAEIAVRAGTLQFYKAGIQPITNIELEKY